MLIFIIFLGGAGPHAWPQDAVNKGVEAARGGRLDKAIELWSRAIRKNPKSYAAYINRGSAYMMTGFVLKGIDDWHKAKKYEPIFAYGVYRPGFIEEGPADKRALNFGKPLEIDPDYVSSVAMTAAAYLDLGKDPLAAELFRMSIDLTRNPLLKQHLHYWIKTIESSREY